MEDVIKLHKLNCPNFHPNLDLSLDGIQECKSSALSADIYTVSFKGCSTVYPIRIIRPINKFKVNDKENLRKVLEDINMNECFLKTLIADNPKRAFLRCALSHSSSYACEYCEGKAVYITKKKKPGTKGHLAWPTSTANAEPRTIEKIQEITDKIKAGEQLTRDESKGFCGVSILLDQEKFDFLISIPAEYMHSGCIGVVKRLLELTFNVGENRERITKRKLSDASSFNKQISDVQVLREFNRRMRYLDLGVMKAQEMRNISLFFFPLVLNCIPDEFQKEKKNWLQLTFIMRACTISQEEFELIPNALIINTSK